MNFQWVLGSIDETMYTLMEWVSRAAITKAGNAFALLVRCLYSPPRNARNRFAKVKSEGMWWWWWTQRVPGVVLYFRQTCFALPHLRMRWLLKILLNEINGAFYFQFCT